VYGSSQNSRFQKQIQNEGIVEESKVPEFPPNAQNEHRNDLKLPRTALAPIKEQDSSLMSQPPKERKE
jgi:hypothetical protein